MARNRVFVSGALVDRWVTMERVDLDANELRVRPRGNRFSLEEAVHVVREVTGATDAHRIVGSVRAVKDLAKLGAEMLDRSLVIGDLAYDVVPGFLASPVGKGTVSAATVLALLSSLSSAAPGRSDEELLARYLIEKL